MNLSGAWEGTYVQAWMSEVLGEHHMFPIEAELRQEGTVITGTMRDLRPVSEVKYADELRKMKSHLGWLDRRRAEDYVAHNPDAVYRTTLPQDSELTGTVTGCEVAFVKRYLGPYDTAFCVDGREDITRIFDHKVLYLGEANRNGTVITGHYRCPPEAPLDLRVVATFELRRV